MLSNRDQDFIAFCDELRAYVEEHHHFPNKHTATLNKIKYIRKKIYEGTLEEWKREMLESLLIQGTSVFILVVGNQKVKITN